MSNEETPQPVAGEPGERSRDDVLADAVRVLTEAARLTRPVLQKSPTEGEAERYPTWVEFGRSEQADWAEFVTHALAGAAANAGGIGAVLAGRPGSWEAEGVRNLLISTVGEDESDLFEHRTEPVIIQAYVNEIMLDLDVWTTYDAAQARLIRRYDAIGELEAAPDEQERQMDAIADLEDRLETLRAQDWAEYGQNLKVNLERAAARRAGRAVPVVVRLDLTTARPDAELPTTAWDLSAALLEEAIEATPVPGDGRDPLERMENSPPPA